MKTKTLFAVLIFVSASSVAKSQGQPQTLALTPMDTQRSEALNSEMTKPEPRLQKRFDPLPDSNSQQSLYDCRPYKHHLLNIHFDDRPFDTRCESDRTAAILGYEYGPSKKRFWGTFGMAAVPMVAENEIYRNYHPSSTWTREVQYSVGGAGLAAIIAVSLPRLRRRGEQSNYQLLAMCYAAAYTGLLVPTFLVGKH